MTYNGLSSLLTCVRGFVRFVYANPRIGTSSVQKQRVCYSHVRMCSIPKSRGKPTRGSGAPDIDYSSEIDLRRKKTHISKSCGTRRSYALLLCLTHL